MSEKPLQNHSGPQISPKVWPAIPQCLGVLHWILFICLGDKRRQYGKDSPAFNSLSEAMTCIPSTHFLWTRNNHIDPPRCKRLGNVKCPRKGRKWVVLETTINTFQTMHLQSTLFVDFVTHHKMPLFYLLISLRFTCCFVLFVCLPNKNILRTMTMSVFSTIVFPALGIVSGTS